MPCLPSHLGGARGFRISDGRDPEQCFGLPGPPCPGGTPASPGVRGHAGLVGREFSHLFRLGVGECLVGDGSQSLGECGE